jgi:hypothetical protein
MKPLSRTRLASAALIAALLLSLVAGASAYNRTHSVPRAVFLTLPEEVPQPEVAVSAAPLASGGWGLTIATTYFRFTDLCLSEAAAIPVGHAHIIRDGVKIASAYQPVVELGALPPGRHRISVVLRGQDHRALLGRNGLIKAEVTIDVPDERQAGVRPALL